MSLIRLPRRDPSLNLNLPTAQPRRPWSSLCLGATTPLARNAIGTDEVEASFVEPPHIKMHLSTKHILFIQGSHSTQGPMIESFDHGPSAPTQNTQQYLEGCTLANIGGDLPVIQCTASMEMQFWGSTNLQLLEGVPEGHASEELK
ncbi:uncharacterized protein LOC110008527 [Amborella trichopoda]|uniref:uncharacterized protein LOC110008527 n=1 Tax=Amborella trichopoda TaxID=13333 RepID=UPI0009BEFE0F|nr:uncharacterized protein LOC110008527 [Amborella trichopoda]|eukprot:XP_020532121.1 uncharacterized protein LOC110008527 [Amborella trichopoda]